jgi:hypothetical protein
VNRSIGYSPRIPLGTEGRRAGVRPVEATALGRASELDVRSVLLFDISVVRIPIHSHKVSQMIMAEAVYMALA